MGGMQQSPSWNCTPWSRGRRLPTSRRLSGELQPEWGGGLRGPCALRAGEPSGSGPAVAARRELAVSLGGCQAHWTRMSRDSTELVTGRCALPGAPGPVWGPVIPPERGLWLRSLHCSQQSQESGSGSRAGKTEASDHWPGGLGPGPARVRLVDVQGCCRPPLPLQGQMGIWVVPSSLFQILPGAPSPLTAPFAPPLRQAQWG